jgi:hypothetical protein
MLDLYFLYSLINHIQFSSVQFTQPLANTPAKVGYVKHNYQLAGDQGRRGVRRAGGLLAVRTGTRLTQSLTRGHRWKWLWGRRAGPQQAAVGGLTGHCHVDSR